MELYDFLEYVKERRALDTEEIFSFMNVMSDEARRITFALNGAYHTPEEVRDLLSRLFGRPVDPTLRVFPPFYTDFGKTFIWARMCLSMPVVIFRTMAGCMSATDVKSDTTSCLPHSTIIWSLSGARLPIRPPLCWRRTCG